MQSCTGRDRVNPRVTHTHIHAYITQRLKFLHLLALHQRQRGGTIRLTLRPSACQSLSLTSRAEAASRQLSELDTRWIPSQSCTGTYSIAVSTPLCP